MEETANSNSDANTDANTDANADANADLSPLKGVRDDSVGGFFPRPVKSLGFCGVYGATALRPPRRIGARSCAMTKMELLLLGLVGIL